MKTLPELTAAWSRRLYLQKKHIKLREEFWEIKYNAARRAYGHFRMMFHSENTIASANAGIEMLITNYRTAANAKKVTKL